MQGRELAAKKLHDAVKALDIAAVETLLLGNALPSLLVDGTTALHLAVAKQITAANANKMLQILQLLLSSPFCDVAVRNSDNRTVMNLAGHNSLWQIVLLIAEKKISLSSGDITDSGHFGSALIDLIHYCDDYNTIETVVPALLSAGACLSFTTPAHDVPLETDGFTALHWAVYRDMPMILEALLANFPQEFCRKGRCDKTIARLADELGRKECFAVIGVVAYMPVINDELNSYPPEFSNEKDLILKYIDKYLPRDRRRQAINDALNDFHLLGQLNAVRKSMLEPKTLEKYRKMKEEIDRERLTSSSQLFQSAPRKSNPIEISVGSVARPIPVKGVNMFEGVNVGTPAFVDRGYLDRAVTHNTSGDPDSKDALTSRLHR